MVGVPLSSIWWSVNPKQLHWVIICYAWEVPVIGWFGAVWLPWWLWRGMARATAQERPEATARLAGYPRAVAMLVFATSTVGYLIGAIQIRLIAELPYLEAAKILAQGPVLGAVFAAAAYLAAERAVQRAGFPPMEIPGRGLYSRIVLIAVAVAVALSTPLFLLGLSREQSRLEAIRGQELESALGIASDDPAAFQQRLTHLGPHTYAFMVDRATGRVTAGPGVPGLLEDAGLDDIGRILTGPPGWFVSRRLTDQVVATRTLAGAGPPGLVLVAVSPLRDFGQDLARTGLLALLVLLVALGIGYLILRQFALSLVGPIGRLRAAAVEMAAGRLDVAPVGYPGTDEIASLAHAFDRMADRVRTDDHELRAAYQRLIATQAELIQAEKLSTVGRLVSGVAHELNNPLTAVLHLTEEVADMPSLSAEDRELLGIVRQQAYRARAIVRDLLAAVRGREVRRERIVVADLVGGAVSGLAATLDEQGAELVVSVAHDVPDLDADRAGLEQVLVNLIQNGAQAVPHGGVVTLRVWAAEAGVILVVEDNGGGIPPEVLPRIFEPFFTTKHDGEGTGLGLFVTLGIVEAHGGAIRAENRPVSEGSGARFTVTLPGYAALEAEVLEHAPPAPVAAGKVLVVEDEAAIRLALRRWFSRRGWKVEEALNGDDALARCLAAPNGTLDLILTDLRMPGLSGVDLVDRLAVLRPDLHRRLVIMTGDVASPEVAALIARTDRIVLEKPFSFEVLAEVVGRV
ncbi:MAG: ATP-binding protein, partial [Gemmatimonadales bacterium]